MLETNTHVAEQFDTPEQQLESATLGMWTFLATEILFFGGLFLAFIVYRSLYADTFAAASRRLSVAFGGINTAVLLTSSLTMVLAVQSAELNRKRSLILLLVATAILGFAFLGIKSIEYYHDFQEHLIPGPEFRFPGDHPEKAQLFFWLYFGMTGLHAFHLIIGIVIVFYMALAARRGKFSSAYSNPIAMTGLYWHFIDVIWVFLYPLLYLMERSL